MGRSHLYKQSCCHVINEKRGADAGIDGIAYSRLEKRTTQNYLSGQIRGVSRKDIATLGGDVRRTESPLGVLITLEPATKPMMIQEAKAAGQYHHPDMGPDLRLYNHRHSPRNRRGHQAA